jgi:hypothetical protein
MDPHFSTGMDMPVGSDYPVNHLPETKVFNLHEEEMNKKEALSKV